MHACLEKPSLHRPFWRHATLYRALPLLRLVLAGPCSPCFDLADAQAACDFVSLVTVKLARATSWLGEILSPAPVLASCNVFLHQGATAGNCDRRIARATTSLRRNAPDRTTVAATGTERLELSPHAGSHCIPLTALGFFAAHLYGATHTTRQADGSQPRSDLSYRPMQVATAFRVRL